MQTTLFWALLTVSVPWIFALFFYVWLSALCTVGGVDENYWVMAVRGALAAVSVGAVVLALRIRALRQARAIAILLAAPALVVGIELAIFGRIGACSVWW